MLTVICFQELFQEYVVPTESHTICRMDGCDKDYRDRKCLVRHIGSTHNKVSSNLCCFFLMHSKT